MEFMPWIFVVFSSGDEQTWGGVEETSYAMLAKLAMSASNVKSLLPAQKWLVKQLNKGYVYSSTQASDQMVGQVTIASRFSHEFLILLKN